MAAGPGDSIALVPQPLELRLGEGQFTLRQDTTIMVDKDSAAAMNVGRQLAERLRASTGWELKVLPRRRRRHGPARSASPPTAPTRRWAAKATAWRSRRTAY